MSAKKPKGTPRGATRSQKKVDIPVEFVSNEFASTDARLRLEKSSKTAFIYDERMTLHKYEWDSNFPERPERISEPFQRCCELGLPDRCLRLSASEATDNHLLSEHSQKHLDVIVTTKDMDIDQLKKFTEAHHCGFFNQHTEAAARLSAGSVHTVTEAVVSGEARNGFALVRPPGHHAMFEEACGYCVYNNVAMVARSAINDMGLDRVLIVDWDVHHGQATQYSFYDNPSVLYFSVHRFEHMNFWPHLREADYDFVGEGAGKGFNINVPLNQTGMTNADYLAIFHNLLMPIATQYSPQLVIVSAGYDAAIGCPEGQMLVHPACYAHMTSKLMSLAGGKVVVVLEGGYCLQSLSEGVALTLKTLLGDPCPRLEALSEPCDSVKETLLNCITALRPYWSCLSIQETSGEVVIPDISNLSVNTWSEKKYIDGGVYPSYSEDRKVELQNKICQLVAETDLSSPTHRTCLVYDPAMKKHCFAQDPGHPERPQRISYIWDQLMDKGLTDLCQVLSSRMCTEEEALLAHTAEYLNQIKHWSSLEDVQAQLNVALENESIYIHQATYDCTRLACGSLLSVVDKVCSGEVRNGFAVVRPPGHHAECSRARGFCFINHVSVGALYAQKKYPSVQRVLILDWDVHHGNGIQDIFYQNDTVLYISLHRFDYGMFYPGQSGALQNVGEGRGRGFNINIPWSGGRAFGDAEYLAAFHHIILPVAHEFNPDLVIVSSGFDACKGDPLGGLSVTPACYGHMTHLLSCLAGGRVVMALEGGYNLISIAEAASHCVSSLLGHSPSQLGSLTPNKHGVSAISSVIDVHKEFWPCLKFNDPIPNWVKVLPQQGDSSNNSVDNLIEDLGALNVSGKVDSSSSGAVSPLKDCPHLDGCLESCGNPMWICSQCGSSQEPWQCLTCGCVQCGRFVQQHMVDHHSSTGHPLAVSFSDLSVWCYLCDSYIDNSRLSAVKNSIHVDKFGFDIATKPDS